MTGWGARWRLCIPILKQFGLRYLTEPELRRTVQRQLNKGEYWPKLPCWVFSADQGEFTTGDYEEIMNKASCLSLVSIESLGQQREDIDEETLSHISLLPYRHILPNDTYFIDDL
jgi:hypothetical protein